MAGPVREDPRLLDVLLLAVGVGGIALCITLLSQGMRDVMDVGGSCAEGGPYVIGQHCPEGTVPAMLLGSFGLFGFGGLGIAFGSRVGGYGGLPFLGWTALFAVLGWNFLDYGLLNPPAGAGVEWGWLIPGVLFEVMAWVPFVFVVIGIREGLRSRRAGPGPRPEIAANVLRGPAMPASRPTPSAATRRPEPGPASEVRTTLDEIASLIGAVADEAGSGTGASVRRVGDLVPRAARRGGDLAAGTDRTADEFTEGTQALLDRLERLADMRDRGLLEPEEYETAKEAVMRELETRT